MSEHVKDMEGYYEYRTDPKNRIAIPVGWRPQPGEELRLISARKREIPVLQVLTKEEFAARLASVDAHATATPEQKRTLKGWLFTNSRPAEISTQGKLLIPKECCEKAQIEPNSTVVLAGRGQFFEVAHPANYKKLVELERADDALAALNAELGVC